MKKFFSIFLALMLVSSPIFANDNDNKVDKKHTKFFSKETAAAVFLVVLTLIVSNEAQVVPPYPRGYSHGR